jgi:hypothetical protein
LDVEKFAQEAFRRDAKLRYVGIVDNQFHILLSKMREGVPSVTAAEDDRNFIQLMPPILVEAAEKLQRILGDLESVTMRYEKVLLVFFRVKKLVVILSYDPKVTTPFVSAVSDLIRMLGATYLGE